MAGPDVGLPRELTREERAGLAAGLAEELTAAIAESFELVVLTATSAKWRDGRLDARARQAQRRLWRLELLLGELVVDQL